MIRKHITKFLTLLLAVSLVSLPVSAYKELASASENIALGKEVWATSNTAGPLGAADTVDGNPYTIWSCTDNTVAQGVTVDLGKRYRLSEVVLTMRDFVQDEVVHSWAVRASNDRDFNTFVTLGTWGTERMGAGFKWHVPVTDVGEYRYVRATRTIASYTTLAEFEVFPYISNDSADDAKDTAYELSAELVTSLGIMNYEDGFNPNRTITRDEATASVMKAFGFGESGAVQYFTDVPSDNKFAGYIQSAYEAEIVKGVGGGKFHPEDFVTKQEAAIIILKAMGYGYYFDEMGFDLALATAAGKAKINISNGSAYLSRGEFANYLYDAMKKPKAVVSGIEEGSISYAKEDSALYSVFGCEEFKGIVTGNSANSGNYRVTVGTEEYSASEKVYNMLGYNIVYVADEETKAIIAAEKYDNNLLEIPQDKLCVTAANLRNNIIDYYDEDNRKRKESFDSQAKIIYNGSETNDIGINDFNFDAGSVTLLDNNGDDHYEVVFINAGARKVVDVAIYTDGVHKIQATDGAAYNLDSAETAVTLISESGIPLSSLESDDIADIYISKDGRNAKIIACDKQITGKVTAMGDEEITIDGIAYPMSDLLFDRYSRNIIIGNAYTFVYNTEGEIAWNLDEIASSYAYGVLIKSHVDFEKAEVKLFTENGAIGVYALADKLVVDGSSKTPEQVSLSPQVVRYAINGSGEVYKLDTSATDAGGENDRFDGSYFENANNVDYMSGLKSFYDHATMVFRVDDNTKYFRVPYYQDGTIASGPAAEKSFAVKTMPSQNTGYSGSIKFRAYGMDDYKCAELLIEKVIVAEDSSSDTYTTVSGQRGNPLLVTKTSHALLENGEAGIAVEGYIIGGKGKTTIVLDSGSKIVNIYKLHENYTSHDLFDAYRQIGNQAGIPENWKNAVTDISEGDIISYRASEDGTVSELQREFRVADKPNAQPIAQSWYSSYNLWGEIQTPYRLMYGVMYRNKGTLISVGKDIMSYADSPQSEEIYEAGSIPLYIYENGEIDETDFMELVNNSYDNNPAARIMTLQFSGDTKAIIIYKY